MDLPPDLPATGYYELAKEPFTPQHPLWSDGADKRRWVYLPRGRSIDKRDPDAWVFPVGTRFWKEFSIGRRIETRYSERLPDGTWRFATYLWNAEGTHARLAPEDGVRVGDFTVPSRADCVTCHEGPAVPVLGYSAAQLQSRLPAAAGYLHGNCGHCHNERALPGLGFEAAHRASQGNASVERTWRGAVARASDIRARMASHDAARRMPPIGVALPDTEGIALVQRWLTQEKP